MNARCTALTQGLVDCYSLTGPYAVTFNVSPPNSGEIKVNSVWAPSYPWATTYFGGIETNLVAKAKTGFVFSHWVCANGPLMLPYDNDTNSVIINAPENVVAVFLPLDSTENPTGVTGIHFPSAFSPDGIGDLQNEQYAIIVGDDIKDFVFYIYDRWGNTLFQSDDKQLRWDGTYKGMPCNTGVYAYMADVRFKTGNKKVFSGNITLIR
jgi:gliding motility-associated-like protein